MNMPMALNGPTMSSREIAELTGKQHKHVMADIRTMCEQMEIDSADFSAQYKDSTGRTLPCFELDRYHTEVLVTGYDVKRRAAVIKRWYELETGTATPANLSRMEILQIAMESEQARITAESERDQAIATKAQISSSREASVMGKLSAASRKMQKLERELGRNSEEATVIAVEKALGCKYGKQGFRPLRDWCKRNGIMPNKVPCPRYGKVVAWPAKAWLECYRVDLAELFGREGAA